MKITSASYKGGDKITLRAKVVNLGNSKATNIKVDFYFGGNKVYTKPFLLFLLELKAPLLISILFRLI